MTEDIHQGQAVEKLQQFGLREYEAKCFVALTKIRSGTAREVSEQIDIPRTRVYEAVRSLESTGLVEIQHSSPQRFRAIPISEAIEILNERHRTRVNSIEQSLRQLQQSTSVSDPDDNPEIWSLTGQNTITTRVKRLITDADTEVLLLVGDKSTLSGSVYEALSTARDRGIDVVVGARSAEIRDQLSAKLAEQMVYETTLDWLGPSTDAMTPVIGRLVLIDDERLLASSVRQREQSAEERAVCGSGNCNGLVLVLRRLLEEQL